MGRALGADKIYYYPSKSFFFFLGKEGALVCYQKWKEEVRSDFEWRREAAIYNS